MVQKVWSWKREGERWEKRVKMGGIDRILVKISTEKKEWLHTVGYRLLLECWFSVVNIF